MVNKNISNQSHDLMAYFRQSDKECFGISEAQQALPGSGIGAIRELLSDMVRRGLLLRLKKGLYYLIPYEMDPVSFMPEWHKVAGCLVGNTPHYIGYYSALQIHDLITQPALKEQVVVARQVRPTAMKVKDIDFQFIYHNPDHFFGYEETWIDSYQTVFCSDLEKTLVDCLFQPAYAGGIPEIARALHTSRGYLDFEKLLAYAIRFNSQAVIKRLGFLIEILEIETGILEKLKQVKTTSFVILDTELPRIGKFISRWSVQQNLESETIKSALFT